MEHVHTFESNRGAVLSLVSRGDTLFAGCQDGYVTVSGLHVAAPSADELIQVWDLETKTLVRSILVQEVRNLTCPLE
jgi:di- and tripeptidase